MPPDSKLDSLKEFEKKIVFSYIEETHLHDYEHLTRVRVLDLCRELGISAALRNGAILKLCKNEVFSQEMDQHGVEPIIKIHPSFYEEASLLYEGLDTADQTISSQDTSADKIHEDVPAADRFVSISDNQIDTSQAVVALEELSEAIRSSNDLTANPDDKLQISTEINFLKELINQPRIHVIALYDAVKSNNSLKWLTEQAASGLVRQAAVTAFQNLDKLLHIVRSFL